MMRNDLDIFEEVMDCNHVFFRAIFVLDGSDDWRRSKAILEKYPNVEFYCRDEELGPEYDRPVRDGARQVLLEAIQASYGTDGYIFLLHSDEMYYDCPPGALVNAMERLDVDVAEVRNVHFFLHSSMKGRYSYDPNKSVIEQLPFACFPGWPEIRIFKNKRGLQYDINEHGRCAPYGLSRPVLTDFPVRHYLYRSEEQMRKAAVDRSSRGWQTYGVKWMARRGTCYVDVLPGYKFSKQVPPGIKLLSGNTGDFAKS
jgi:hypothetical protein